MDLNRWSRWSSDRSNKRKQEGKPKGPGGRKKTLMTILGLVFFIVILSTLIYTHLTYNSTQGFVRKYQLYLIKEA